MERPAPHPDGYYHLRIFKEDIVYSRRSHYADRRRLNPSKDAIRGEIKSFSKRSRLRLVHNLRNSQHTFRQFITLTYPEEFPTDGRVVKEHLNALLTRMRQEFDGFHYIWVFEAQTRGAPHFHIIINVDLPNELLHDRHGAYHFSKVWAERWSSITGNAGNHKHIRHGLRIDPITDNNPKALAAYMAKYYTKNDQKEFGPGFRGIGRFWGASREFATPLIQGVYLASELKWMLKLCFHHANLERAKAGYGRHRYSVERGCSIWSLTGIFGSRIQEQFKKRLDSPFMGLEKPPTIYNSPLPAT